MMMVMIYPSSDQFTTSLVFSYILYLLLQGWYRHYHTNPNHYQTDHYHRKQSKSGFDKDLFKFFEQKPDVLDYRYDALSPFPLIVRASSNENPLIEMFRRYVNMQNMT